MSTTTGRTVTTLRELERIGGAALSSVREPAERAAARLETMATATDRPHQEDPG